MSVRHLVEHTHLLHVLLPVCDLQKSLLQIPVKFLSAAAVEVVGYFLRCDSCATIY